MELPFHTAIPYKFVCHYHSVYFLLCSISGLSKKFIQYYESEDNIKAQLISYKEPGQSLFASINTIILDLAEVPKVIFLENHGIIVSSETDSECMYIIKALNNFLANFLEEYFSGLSLYNEVFFKDFKNLQFQTVKESILLSPSTLINLRSSLSKITSNTVLFPDQMVALGYTNNIFCDNYISESIKSSKTVNILDCASNESVSKFKSNNNAQSYYILVAMLLLLLASGERGKKLNLIHKLDCESLLLNPDERYRKERMEGAK